MKFTKNNQEVIRETGDITNVSHIQAGDTVSQGVTFSSEVIN